MHRRPSKPHISSFHLAEIQNLVPVLAAGGREEDWGGSVTAPATR